MGKDKIIIFLALEETKMDFPKYWDWPRFGEDPKPLLPGYFSNTYSTLLQYTYIRSRPHLESLSLSLFNQNFSKTKTEPTNWNSQKPEKEVENVDEYPAYIHMQKQSFQAGGPNVV